MKKRVSIIALLSLTMVAILNQDGFAQSSNLPGAEAKCSP